MEHLEQLYIDFETMQREIVIWLDNAEDILREFDQLKEGIELSDNDINKFKVKRVFISFQLTCCFTTLPSYIPLMAAKNYGHIYSHASVVCSTCSMKVITVN